MIRLGLAYISVVIISVALITGYPLALFDDANPTAATTDGATSAAAQDQAANDAALAEDTAARLQAAALLAVTASQEQSAQVDAEAVTDAVNAALQAAITDGGAEVAAEAAPSTLAPATADVLNALFAASPEPQASAISEEEQKLFSMSNAALNGLRGLRGEESANAAQTLEDLVGTALAEGRDDAYIDALINDAVATGRITVPSMLITAEGRVDTEVLLATIVNTVQAEEGVLAEGDLSDPEDQTSRDALSQYLDTEDLLYTVAKGDSLGALALRFYGDAAKAVVILDANRDKLASETDLQVGQRLVLPSRLKL